MSNYYVGGKVVCVKTHSQQKVIKGKEYEIEYIDVCKCGDVSFIIKGVGHHKPFASSCFCGIEKRGMLLLSSILFRPLLTDSIKFAEEVLEKVKEHIESRELILYN
jgi:hypothetical protein